MLLLAGSGPASVLSLFIAVQRQLPSAAAGLHCAAQSLPAWQPTTWRSQGLKGLQRTDA